MILVCLLFGGLGVHNFMMGEKGKGIVRLVLTLMFYGLGVLLAVWDLLKLITNTYRCKS